MFERSALYRLLIMSVLVILPVPAFAVASLSIASPAADGTFVISGDRIEEAAGMDIRISYDARTLKNPRVQMGSLVSGMMNAANPNNPIRIAIVGTKAIGGSGIIATIAFDRIGTSPGAITAMTGSLIDTSGRQLVMTQPTISNPVEPVADGETQPDDPQKDNQAGDPQTDTPSINGDNSADSGNNSEGAETPVRQTASGQPFVVGGTLTYPPEENLQEQGEQAPQTGQLEKPEARPEQHPEPENEPPVPEAESGARETKAPERQVTQPKAIPSVVERFRVFQGEKTVANFSELFKRDAADPFSQIPAIGVADGQATVLLIIAMETGDRAPNFAFNAAGYVSLQRTSQGEWEVEVRPDKDAVNASVTMLYNGLVQELPITVTPKAELVAGTPRAVTEADFQQFLKVRGTPSAPAFDLNGDGLRDYLDDYIFAANYLVEMDGQSKEKKGTR